MAKEIHGIGFALGCDFFKKLGYDQYPKPDVHLMEIFSELEISENEQYDCYKAIIRMAKAVGETPYKEDKIFWLINSGNYHKDGITTKQYKKEFIEDVKSKKHSLRQARPKDEESPVEFPVESSGLYLWAKSSPNTRRASKKSKRLTIPLG